MDEKLARTIDDLEIRQVLARYCRGVDRLDVASVLSCFQSPSLAEPCVFCGPFSGSPRDWVDYVFARMRTDLLTTHHLCQSVIAIEGDEAEAESYFLARHVYDDNGVFTVMRVAGRYGDRLVRGCGGWKISRRTVFMDLREYGPAGAPGATRDEFVRRPDDPSHLLTWL